MSESHPSETPPQNPESNLTTNEPSLDEENKTLPIKTHHCRFCNHLLLATTHSLSSLPRRKDPARDAALILPLPLPRPTANDDDDESTNADAKGVKHYSILLSTSIPDRRATLVRREDGFEKRLFLRCGRCRVVVGYFLDGVHFPGHTEDNGADAGGAKVVYLLPGGLVETDIMGDEEKVKAMDQEWSGWE